jgi:hypothetical protein
MAKNKMSLASDKMKSSEKISLKAVAQKKVHKKRERRVTDLKPSKDVSDNTNLQDTCKSYEKDKSKGKTLDLRKDNLKNIAVKYSEQSDLDIKENDGSYLLEIGDNVTLKVDILEIITDKKCKCMQKKPGGKYFYFRLIQGKWVQSSAVPFDTEIDCEDIYC